MSTPPPLPSYELIFKIIDTFLLFLQSMTMMTIFRQKTKTIPANLDKIRQRDVYVVNVLIKSCKFHVALFVFHRNN